MKHRFAALALILALALTLLTLPVSAFSPEEQYDILLETDELIRTQGLESSLSDDPLGRVLIRMLEEDPGLFDQLMSRMLDQYDIHTMYIPAGSYSQVFQQDDSYVGIGVTMQSHPKGALVTEVNLSGPAAKAGVQPGDVLVRAGKTDLDGMPLEAIAELIRGDEGTSVEVTLLRDGQTLTLTLTRRKVGQRNYFGTHLEDGVYYMRWSHILDDGSYADYQNGLAEMEALGDRCLILDLRDNPGGSLDLAFSIVSDLLPEERAFFRIAYRVERDREVLAQQLIVSEGDGYDIPHIFLLVNGETASAAEIIAAGLRDTGCGLMVGTQTYGKARAQQHLLLEDDSAVILTTMKLLSLRAGDYNGTGLTPDVTVGNTVYRGDSAIILREDVPLAPYSCSDDGEALNRALVALGLLDGMPDIPYQVGEDTLAALAQLKAAYQLGDQPGASKGALILINRLLVLQGQGAYTLDDQLSTAIQLARDALAQDAAQAEKK